MIYTNKFKPNLNVEKIDRDFDIYEISREAGSFFKTNVLDIPKLKFNAVSVVYTWGNKWYTMFKKNEVNKNKLKEALECQVENIRVEKIKLREDKIFENIKIQLLLNAINSIELEGDYNNVMGKLYIYQGKRNYDKEKKILSDFWMLQLDITKDLYIKLSVKSFSNLEYFRETKYEGKPKFMFDENNGVLRKLLKEDQEKEREIFIEKSRWGKSHNTMEFLNFMNYRKFINSKIGVLEEFIRRVNEGLGDYVKIELEGIEEFSEFKLNTRWCEQIQCKELINKKMLMIEDSIKNKESKELINSITEYCVKNNIEVKLGKVNKDAYNIKIIHNKDYYEYLKIEDEYKSVLNKVIVQHITLENFGGGKKSKEESGIEKGLDKILQELIIKEDLLKKRIGIVNWESIGYKESLTFVKRKKYKKSKKSTKNDAAIYGIMRVSPLGDLTIKTYGTEEEFNLDFDIDSIESIYDKYDKEFCNREVDGLFYKDIDKINLIIKTERSTIPNSSELYDRLKRSDGQENIDRDVLASSLEEIKKECEDETEIDKINEIIEYLQDKPKFLKKEEVLKNGFKGMKKKVNQRLNDMLDKRYGILMHPRLRGEVAREKYLKSVTGIKYFEENNKLYYFVGAKGAGIKEKIPTACTIREFIGDKNEFEEIVNLLEVEFVKNGQYTVLPFVYKYLNEILEDKFRNRV